MAKEKSGASSVVLRGTVTQGAANGFIQASLLTGLSAGGSDALIIKEIAFEFPSLGFSTTAAFEQEAALCRASKAAMPSLLDDDVLYKAKHAVWSGAAGMMAEPGIVRYNPVVDMVVIEDTIYFDFKTANAATAGACNVVITAVPATVTESEKVGILLTRLN